jgi:hypothetical protein
MILITETGYEVLTKRNDEIIWDCINLISKFIIII